MAEVIYRKYRPQQFSEVVGQRPIKITLQNEILSGKLAHAYLLVGPRGTGKTTLARLFARSLNCLNRQANESEPCNHCQNCELLAQGRSLDIIEIDAASHTGVDNVRENIIANAQVPPFNAKGYKVFIIDEVHMLSKSAFNALLKTLEEPPQQVIFILATTEIHKVPETIISRCQRFDFKKISQSEIVKRLTEIVEWEKVSIDDPVLSAIARRAEGSLRDAESLLGQIISLSHGKVTDDLVSLVLPRSNWQEIDVLVEALRLHNLTAALNQINKLVNEGVDLDSLTSDLLEYLRQIMLCQIIGSDYTLDFDDNIAEIIKKHAANFPLPELARLLNILLNKMQAKNASLIDQLPLELACVEFLLSTAEQVPVSFSKSNKETIKEQLITKEVPIAEQKTNSGEYDSLKSRWSELIELTRPFNHSLSAVLQNSHLLSLVGDKAIIGCEYSFHIEQLSKADAKQQIMDNLSKIIGRPINFSAELDANYQENHQRFKGRFEEGIGEIVDTFGGELV